MRLVFVDSVFIRTIGIASVGVGVFIAVFSRLIVFPGLEMILGIETLVGKENVNYQPNGNYAYTNPGAMAAWILTVSWIGLLSAAIGAVVLFRTRKRAG